MYRGRLKNDLAPFDHAYGSRPHRPVLALAEFKVDRNQSILQLADTPRAAFLIYQFVKRSRILHVYACHTDVGAFLFFLFQRRCGIG
jgi:hypothetical protein